MIPWKQLQSQDTVLRVVYYHSLDWQSCNDEQRHGKLKLVRLKSQDVKVLFCFCTSMAFLCLVDLAWLETADLPSYLTEKDCRQTGQRVQLAVKSSTLDNHDIPFTFNHKNFERKTHYF